ncbi:hypothetical protein [Clostridium sp. J1101437_171009_A5]|uniref:hypothetical protein n=1 Tax=Clostridium sp. J1101437_171009_A5 TaxID=2787098 RepID=UPI001896A834|nr:hypothetical protein [Clostridium sp. J1101437_171009_A5]
MIQTEIFENNGRKLMRTFSDTGHMIRQDGTGVVYSEAIDPAESGRTYTETDEKVPDRELTAEEALEIITGGGAV